MSFWQHRLGPSGRQRINLCFRLLGYLLLAAGAYWSTRKIDGHALWRTLAHAGPVSLAIGCLLAVAQLVCRGDVFRTLMMPVARLSWLRVQRLMMTTSAATAVLPGRAGEFMRAYLLKRDDNVPVASTAAVIAVEKIAEVLGLSLILAPVPWIVQDLPAWAERSLPVVAGVAAGLLLLATLVARWRPPRWLARFSDGLKIIRQPSLFGRALLLSIAGWLLDLASLYAIVRAVGAAAPPASGLLVLLAVNLAIAVPVVPGNLGTFELGAVAGLQPFGVSPEIGLAVGLLYHLAQVVPIAVLALLDGGLSVDLAKHPEIPRAADRSVI